MNSLTNIDNSTSIEKTEKNEKTLLNFDFQIYEDGLDKQKIIIRNINIL